MSENLVAPLRPLEYEALKDSIRANGVTYPVIISSGPTVGRIIDGFHRQQICDELGMECPTQKKKYDSVEDEDSAALLLNAQRRQLDDYSGGLLYKEMMRIRGIPGRGKRSASGYTTEMLVAELGVSMSTFWRRVQLANFLSRDEMVDIRESYQREEITSSEAVKLVKARDQLALEGKSMSDDEMQLKSLLGRLGTPKQALPPTKAARLEGFTEGLRWGWKALQDIPLSEDWVERQLEDWRESVDI